MEIIKHYYRDDALRQSFNALAEATFGLSFENWYRNGFWGDSYDPYSIVEEGRVVANVSVNRTDLVLNGQRKRIYQLGTVMTAPEYRNRGYIRAILAEVEADIAGADGIYLFANDSVVTFYPKFGFLKGRETVWSRSVCQNTEQTVEQVLMDGPENWARLEQAMTEAQPYSSCEMVDNPGLIFFYASQFLQENVFYSNELDTWTIAELEDGVLTLHAIFSRKKVSPEAVIQSFGPEVKQAVLGFSPLETEGFTPRELTEEDSTFFVKGDAFRDFGEKGLRIPSLSHA